MKKTSAKTAPIETASAKAASANTAPTKNAPTKNAPTKNVAATDKSAPEGMPGAPASRPRTVTAATALTGLIAALLFAYGLYLIVAGLSGQPVLRARAELGGALFALFGLGIGWVARGLLRVEAWARTPAVLTHLLVLAACYWMVQGGYYGEAAPTGLYGLAGIVLLFVPASHRVLSREVH
ncbi:hypothetical protein KGA66_23485 [Actinocrinis puniceicyclus]|uniref:Integral membrane protein n=1 Tax=Actinocrinis puniceicyclus TaxID=977794 RepID=A0A8J7WT60_9ACTN|nr:hypothetical protein [Actinocrinis puniceicyclus]MBS2966027.1 hypothetical protein [Actinocrinis puniceicyclus]